MGFAELQAKNAKGIVDGPKSETITIRLWPLMADDSISAVVSREPLTELGDVVSNMVEVYAEKADWATVTRDKDQVVVDGTVYTVIKKTDNGGSWTIRAIA